MGRNRMFDFLIVGAGLYGSVVANRLTSAGKSCLIVDKRPHIAGNCYTYNQNDIEVHAYGPHIFHTSNQQVWEFVNKYANFIPFTLNVKSNYRDKIYSLPVNLNTFYEFFGFTTPWQAKSYIQSLAAPTEDNLEAVGISQVGREIYNTLFYGYTKKQWHREPRELPSFIFKRLPVRFDWNNNYFFDKWQGIPEHGYTSFVGNIIGSIPIELNCNFFDMDWRKEAKNLIYTGGIDEVYKYQFGKLEYLSLRFEHELLEGDFQGCSNMNFSDELVPWTRITEHKYFLPHKNASTVITKEYPMLGGDPYYPVQTAENIKLYNAYADIKEAGVYFGGRLGSFNYLNMDKIILSAFLNLPFLL